MGKKIKNKIERLKLNAVVEETFKWDKLKFEKDETTKEWSDKVNKLVMQNPTKLQQMQAIKEDDEFINFLRENYGNFLGKFTKEFSIRNYNSTLKQKFNTHLEVKFLIGNYEKEKSSVDLQQLSEPINLDMEVSIATNSGKNRPYKLIIQNIPHHFYSEQENKYYLSNEVLEALYHLYTINMMTTTKVKFDLELTKTLKSYEFTSEDKGYILLGSDKTNVEILDTFDEERYKYEDLELVKEYVTDVTYKDVNYTVPVLELSHKGSLIYGLNLTDGVQFIKAINNI